MVINSNWILCNRGAIGGILLAGEELGYEFAATIGGLFAPAGVIPAMLLGLFLLNLCPKF